MARKPQAAPTVSPYLAQLQAIKAALTGGLYMTQAEGNDIVAAGLAVVDTANVDGDKAFVSLTPAGEALVAGQAAPAPVAAKPTFTISADVPFPTKTRKAKAAIYPIDQLEVGQSFHLATTDAIPDPFARLQSTAINYRAKYTQEVKDEAGNTVMETVTRKVYQRGEDGKIAIGEDGHRIVTGMETVSVPKTELTRDFMVWSVDASDKEGVGARMGRTK